MENKLQQAKDMISKKYGYKTFEEIPYTHLSSINVRYENYQDIVNDVAIEYNRLCNERVSVDEIRLDTILVAKDECKMHDGSGNALVVGEEYSINFIEQKDEEFAITSNVHSNHYFSTNKKCNSYWKRFFDLKRPQPPK